LLSVIGLRPSRRDPERGATSIEYALMVSLIAIVIIGGVTFFGQSVMSALFNGVATSI
jgi:pilus assembly protein Flp/PilA